jgi:hypothetical protein
MGLDEERTLANLKSFRKTLVDPNITEHRGRTVKTTGDGMLVFSESWAVPTKNRGKILDPGDDLGRANGQPNADQGGDIGIRRPMPDDICSPSPRRRPRLAARTTSETFRAVREGLTVNSYSNERTYTTKHSTTAVMNTAAIGKPRWAS